MKRKLFSALLTVLFVFNSVSCSNSENAEESSTVSETAGETAAESAAPKENGEDIIITMPVWVDLAEKEKKVIDEFNNADNGYRIVLRNLTDGAESIDEFGTLDENEANVIETRYIFDIVNGKEADIVTNNFSKFDILANQGAYADLRQYIDNDPEINRSVLNNHILELLETEDEKLYYMPLYYEIQTLAGPAKYVGDKENWTMDELIAHWEQMPEGSTIGRHTEKDYVYMQLLRGNLGSYFDYKTGMVDFDNPEFIRILDFCNSFDDIADYKPEPDWNAPEFLSEFHISSVDSFHGSLFDAERNGSGEITLVGYPTDDGSGAFINLHSKYAINACSSPEVQKGAWEFLRMLLSEEYMESEPMGFPINENSFKNMAEESLSKQGTPNVISVCGNEYDYGWITQEEYDRLIKYINSVNKLGNYLYNDDSLWDIINDEIYKFFEGAQTSAETAANIQNRAYILVNEKQ